MEKFKWHTNLLKQVSQHYHFPDLLARSTWHTYHNMYPPHQTSHTLTSCSHFIAIFPFLPFKTSTKPNASHKKILEKCSLKIHPPLRYLQEARHVTLCIGRRVMQMWLVAIHRKCSANKQNTSNTLKLAFLTLTVIFLSLRLDKTWGQSFKILVLVTRVGIFRLVLPK